MADAHKVHRHRIRHCPVAKSTFTTYMDEGVMHYRAQRYRKSLYCFDRAIELEPTHKAALVARSQCHLKLGDAASALKDAEASFDKTGMFVKGLFQYAEALYNLGSFEKALIAYHRGSRARRDMEGFRIGVQKCQEAIRVAIGNQTATQIEDLDEILPMIEEIESMKNQKKVHCCVRPGTDEGIHKHGDASTLSRPSKARARWVAREILGQMYDDKQYLIKFLNRPDIQSDHGAAQELRSNATEALNYLEIREEFWRQENPMYSRKPGLNYNNNMVGQYESLEHERKEASRRIKMDAAEGSILKSLSLIEHSLAIGRSRDCQIECERAMRQLKELTGKLLPRKQEFMCQVCHYKGLALMKMKKYDQAGEAFQTELNTATEAKSLELKSRALDHLARSFALKEEYAEAAEIWETRMTLAKTPLERTYLFHEIGRCYMETNKLDIAKYYGTQSFEEAQKIDDNIWSMNARIFLGQLEIKNMNLETAAAHFEAAETFAKLCGNSGNAQLLHEARMCLKVWAEKREQQENDVFAALNREPVDDDYN